MEFDEHHQRCVLRGTWQLASVFHFLNVFRSVLHFNLKFSMEELESALLTPNDLLGDIHIGLLKAIPPILRNPINRETWIAALSKKLKEWWHAVAEGPFPLVPQHGDELTTYKHLTPEVRVLILKALCEARLDQEDMRAFISEMSKQETSLLSIRKEITGTDMAGATYWYEGDRIAGYRLYRELQRSSDKEKIKHRGHLMSAPAMGHWETLATNLFEFQSIVDKLLSSKNKMEVVLGNKINSDIVPDLINAEKRKERLLKKQSRDASLLESHFNADSVACSRPRRECKPVSYTFDDYENSINEAIDVMKGLYASRVMEGRLSTSQDREEEDNGDMQCQENAATHDLKSDFCSNKHSSRHGRNTRSMLECDSDTSVECNDIEEAAASACADQLPFKRGRTGSLEANDHKRDASKDMNAAGVSDLEENGASELNSKAAVLNGKGSLNISKKTQQSLLQSSRSTRSKAEVEIPHWDGMEVEV